MQNYMAASVRVNERAPVTFYENEKSWTTPNYVYRK